MKYANVGFFQQVVYLSSTRKFCSFPDSNIFYPTKSNVFRSVANLSSDHSVGDID